MKKEIRNKEIRKEEENRTCALVALRLLWYRKSNMKKVHHFTGESSCYLRKKAYRS